MEAFIGLVILFALVALILPIVMSVTNASRLRAVEATIKKLSERIATLEVARPHETVAKETAPVASASIPRASPPPLPVSITALPARLTRPTPAVSKTAPSAIDWEAFMGVKLFAWIGGFVFFLGVVFLVKYSFENNLITPRMRIAIGAIIGLGLIAAGWRAVKKNYRIPGESLCATGILVLYADTYAAHAFYQLISTVGSSVLMCSITAAALFLATRLEAQSVVWLAVLGGFLTPALFWTRRDNPAALFGYVAILNFGLATVATLKRWNYFLVLAGFGTVALEIAWASDFFGIATADVARRILLLLEAQFLAICIARQRIRPGEDWSAIATAIVAFAALIFCGAVSNHQEKYPADFIYPVLLFADAGLIAIGVARRVPQDKERISGVIIAGGLFLTWLAEWVWHDAMFQSGQPLLGIVWYAAIFLLFAATPYFCGTNRVWSWIIAAVAGPLQFWFVYRLLALRFPNDWMFLLPLAFAIPAAAGFFYLLHKEKVTLDSGDSRLASQSAAFLFFISLIFPVQFEREWITLGWAIEGVALLLLFRRIPNRPLKIVALLVLGAAFVRLALNPAVLEYHRRSPTKIWNWYLYAYGLSSICLFASARLFQSWRKHVIERIAPPFLYSLGTILAFLLLNIEIADYFSIGPTLTFSFSGNFARDMTYSIAWAVFAFSLLLIGMKQKSGAVRYAGLALLLITLAKLFLHDLSNLNQLYRIGAFIGVAIVLIVASFIYQRFLAPSAKTQ